MIIYGTPYEFLYENPEIYDMNVADIYKKVKEYNGALIQAHPYRSGVPFLDANFLDGVEINCYVRFGETFREEILEFANMNSLHITCGSDYHATHRRPKCGMVIPGDIKDSIELKDYILSNNKKIILVDESEEEEPCFINILK